MTEVFTKAVLHTTAPYQKLVFFLTKLQLSISMPK